MKFPREVWPNGNRQSKQNMQRVKVHNQQEFNDFVKLYNGRMNCYTSVYSFETFTAKKDGVAHESSIIMDKIFLDFDAHHGEIDKRTGAQIIRASEINKCLEDLNLICQYLIVNDYKFDMSFSGRGFHLFVYGEVITDIRRLTAFFNEVKKLTVNGTLDKSAIQKRRLRRIKNTMNLKASYGEGCYYCIPLELNDIFLDAEDLLVLAMNPNNIKPISYGSKLVDWPEVPPIEESEIEAEVINMGNLPLPPCMHSAIMVENPTDDARMRVVSWYKDLLLGTDLSIPFTNFNILPNKETRIKIGNQIVAEIKNLHEKYNVWLDFNEEITKQRMGSILEKNYSFPRCETLIGQGYCVGKCWRLKNAKDTV